MKLVKVLLAPYSQPWTLAVEAMISEQNTALSLGVDVKLVVHQEDEQDRQARPDRSLRRIWGEFHLGVK